MNGRTAGIVFFGGLAVLFSLLLFVPQIRQGLPDVGVSAALGLPGWALMAAGIAVCVIFVAVIILRKPK